MRGFPILVIAGLVGCAHNVPQDAATGPDGRIGGARPIALDSDREGVARGIVTYPGGDRVDWKSIELPTGKRGTLELAMTYTTPRPGLHLSFDVFDQTAAPLKLAVHKRGRVHEAAIDHARGTYFVRVYAPRRGDAGTYKLAVKFTEDAMPPNVAAVEIPDPPKLAAVPPPEDPCDHFDSRNPACATACPDDAPTTWHGCQNTCRTPDAHNPACWKTMACPTPPDRHVDDCVANVTKNWTPCQDFNHPDPTNPLCDPQYRKPIAANVIGVQAYGDYVLITLDVGADNGIDTHWVAHVLRGNTDTLLDGGNVTLVRVGRRASVAKVRLTTDVITANPHLRLSAP